MKKTVLFLSILVILLGGWAAAIWLLPIADSPYHIKETKYGLYEDRQLVEQTVQDGSRCYVVEDKDGQALFNIPLRNCIIDTHYRNGKLRFREQDTQREGYIDKQGFITFLDQGLSKKFAGSEGKMQAITSTQQGQAMATNTSPSKPNQTPTTASSKQNHGTMSVDKLRNMAQDNPFYKEATKVLQGKLNETDAEHRRIILNYCEHFRTAYTTKDIDFLRQVFSDNALIIVGNVVKSVKENDKKYAADEQVAYALHTKKDYIYRLGKVFSTNKNIEVKFSNFHIMRHPTKDGIYGVSLRQQYKSDRYSDDGYLFLLWDFRDKSMPLIHVRTWQPKQTVSDANDIISIRDFNLE